MPVVPLHRMVLCVPCRRKLYDECGVVDEEHGLTEETCQGLYEYYKRQFNEVTEDAILEFSAAYKYSEEERNDLESYYTSFEGDMNAVFDHVMLSDVDDDGERFIDMLDRGIEEGRVEMYQKYKEWKDTFLKKTKARGGGKRKRLAKSKGQNGAKGKRQNEEGSLEQLILARRGGEQGGFASFAAKWGCDLDHGDDPISDAEFEKARARLETSKRKTDT